MGEAPSSVGKEEQGPIPAINLGPVSCSIFGASLFDIRSIIRTCAGEYTSRLPCLPHVALFGRSTHWQQIKLDHNVSFRPYHPSTSVPLKFIVLSCVVVPHPGIPLCFNGLQALDLMTCAFGGFEAINVSQSLGGMPCLNTTDFRLMCLTFFSQLILNFFFLVLLYCQAVQSIKSKCLRYAAMVLRFVQACWPSHSPY